MKNTCLEEKNDLDAWYKCQKAWQGLLEICLVEVYLKEYKTKSSYLILFVIEAMIIDTLLISWM